MGIGHMFTHELSKHRWKHAGERKGKREAWREAKRKFGKELDVADARTQKYEGFAVRALEEKQAAEAKASASEKELEALRLRVKKLQYNLAPEKLALAQRGEVPHMAPPTGVPPEKRFIRPAARLGPPAQTVHDVNYWKARFELLDGTARLYGTQKLSADEMREYQELVRKGWARRA